MAKPKSDDSDSPTSARRKNDDGEAAEDVKCTARDDMTRTLASERGAGVAYARGSRGASVGRDPRQRTGVERTRSQSLSFESGNIELVASGAAVGYSVVVLPPVD